MASSGTYAFSQSNADIVLGALGRIRIRPTAVVTEQLQQAARQANLLLVEWSNKQPNLFTSELQELTLSEGDPTYTLPARTIMVLIAYRRADADEETQQDTVITPVSTTDYASYPDKLRQGQPTAYWFDRQITPQVSFYPCPDDTYTIKLQCVRQMQDANLPTGETPDLPYRWLDAFEAGLAHRLSRFYAPELEQLRKADAMEAWAIAATQDTENAPMYITPMLSRYRS